MSTSSTSSGWNHPQQNAPKVTPKKPNAMRGIVAGLVVVAIAAACVVVFMGKGEKPVEKTAKEPTAIKEVTPAVVAKEEPKKPVDPKEDYDHEKCYRDERGILRYKTGCRAPDPTRPRSKPLKAASYQKPSPFTNGFERALCSLLTRKPGSITLARRNYYDKDFENDYLESVMQPIKILETDSPRNKRLKEAVLAAREEVSRRFKAGESIGDILTSAENELTRLREYKRNVEKEVGDAIEKGGMGTDDVKDLIKAANTMFEKEGLAPISDDSFVRWNLRLTAEREGSDPNEAEASYDAQQANKAAHNEAENRHTEATNDK